MQPAIDQPEAERLRRWIDARDPQAKFFVLARLLRCRRDYGALFSSDAYTPLHPEGDAADHWLSFLRTTDEAALLVAVPRFPATWSPEASAAIPLPDAWANRSWTELLSGASLDVGEALSVQALPLPWAVLRTEKR
jgi:maltooligosyltrehalose synthase